MVWLQRTWLSSSVLIFLRFTVFLSSSKFYFSLMSLMAFLTTGLFFTGGGPSSINFSGSLQNNKITFQKRFIKHERKSDEVGEEERGHQTMLWKSLGLNGSSKQFITVFRGIHKHFLFTCFLPGCRNSHWAWTKRFEDRLTGFSNISWIHYDSWFHGD